MPLLSLTDVDGLAVTMIAALVGSFGIILLILFTLARNAGKKHEVDLEAPEDRRGAHRPSRGPSAPAAEEPNARNAWERDPDWWQA